VSYKTRKKEQKLGLEIARYQRRFPLSIPTKSLSLSLYAAMSSPSVPDSVTCATPKAQSLSKQRSITDDKSASHPNASNQGGSSKKRKRQTKKQVKESKKEEKEKGDIVPPSTMKKTKKVSPYLHITNTGYNLALLSLMQGSIF